MQIYTTTPPMNQNIYLQYVATTAAFYYPKPKITSINQQLNLNL